MPTKTKYDTIIVLGGGLDANKQINAWAAARLDALLASWNGEPIISCSAGTPHKPPALDNSGFPIFESVASANYLISRGIPADKIMVETSSYDTIGNAYFSWVTHCNPKRWRKFLVITSDFHLPRTKKIFDWVFHLGHKDCRIKYLSAPNTGMTKKILGKRLEKEKDGLENIVNLSKRIKTFEQLHDWMYAEHKAYAAGQKEGAILKGAIIDSY